MRRHTMISCNKGRIEIVGKMAEIKADLVCVISTLCEDIKDARKKAKFQADLLTDICKGLALTNHIDELK